MFEAKKNISKLLVNYIMHRVGWSYKHIKREESTVKKLCFTNLIRSPQLQIR